VPINCGAALLTASETSTDLISFGAMTTGESGNSVPIGSAEDRSHGEIAYGQVVPQLQLAAPSRFNRPVGCELFMRRRDGHMTGDLRAS
jgi:hypothetical protein